jgi:peptidoglycan/xylan/chitin deacetylase (PgdA/CDA1 family)
MRTGPVRTLALLTALATALVGICGAPALAEPSTISVAIAAPPPDAAVAGTVTVQALTQGAATSVTFDWSRDRGASWNPIGGASAGEVGWSAAWDTTGLSGPVILRATASEGVGTTEASEPLSLANTPSITGRASPEWFAPQAGPRRGSITVTITASAPLTTDVTVVRMATGRTVSTLASDLAGSTMVEWDGRETGTAVRDGAYAVDVVSTDEVGDEAWDSAIVHVDDRAPRVSWRWIRPEPLRTTSRITFAFGSGDNQSLTLTVRLDVAGVLGRVYAGPRQNRRSGDGTVGWLPRDADGRPLVPGTYRARLTVTDRAGNSARSRWRAFRILRPVTTRVYRGFTGVGRVAALTFDDCSDATAWGSILSTLDRMHVRASFFCLGGRVAGNPALARRTAAGHHTIGNQTWSHPYMPGLPGAAVSSELSRVDAVWWRIARITPAPFFRPPYGSYDASNLQVAGELGYARTMLWSVDPRDWSGPGASVIASRVLSETMPGGIVVLHTLSQTAEALPAIVAGLRTRGFRLVNLDELFQLAGSHGSVAVLGPAQQLARQTG